MAKIEMLRPFILKSEGGYVNDKDDSGGATNMGVTLVTWQQVGYDKDGDLDIDSDDIRLLEPKDFDLVLKRYWDRWRANEIKNQSIANILVDWVYNSGSHGIKIPQGLMALPKDGIVGRLTLACVNQMNQEKLFENIFNARLFFYKNIALKRPSQRKFLNGWMNRLSHFKYSE